MLIRRKSTKKTLTTGRIAWPSAETTLRRPPTRPSTRNTRTACKILIRLEGCPGMIDDSSEERMTAVSRRFHASSKNGRNQCAKAFSASSAEKRYTKNKLRLSKRTARCDLEPSGLDNVVIL